MGNENERERGSLSVLLATRNRSQILSSFLARLTQLDHPHDWELILVDNDSSDDTQAVANRYLDQLPLMLLQESRRGKSRALNRGIAAARGELLVFVDDDITPRQDWLLCWQQASVDFPEINVFGGRICVDAETLPRWLNRSFNLRNLLTAEHDLGTENRGYSFNQYPWGPNLAVRRSALAVVERPWPENVGPGSQLPVGDEYAFLSKISRPSAPDRLYLAQSIVNHQPEHKDITFPGTMIRCFQGGWASGRLRVRDTQPEAQADPFLENRPRLVRRTLHRLRACRSMMELFLIAVRASGTCCGTLARWLWGRSSG